MRSSSCIHLYRLISAQKSNQVLCQLGLQEPFRDLKNKLTWKVTASGKKYAVLKDFRPAFAHVPISSSTLRKVLAKAVFETGFIRKPSMPISFAFSFEIFLLKPVHSMTGHFLKLVVFSLTKSEFLSIEI